MSDYGHTTPREEPFDGAHDAVRDALPALLHGRVTAAERAELDAHLAGCAGCAAELRTLARLRDLQLADAPPIALDRIAAAVRARTVPVTPTAPGRTFAPLVAPIGAPSASRAATAPARARRAPAWARRGSLHALAATLLVAFGSGAVLLQSSDHVPARRAVQVAAQTATRGAVQTTARSIDAPVAVADPGGSLLGASFSDLDDRELAAVVAAVDDPAPAAPSADPTPVTPTVLAPDGE